jgi:hypothetical protein
MMAFCTLTLWTWWCSCKPSNCKTPIYEINIQHTHKRCANAQYSFWLQTHPTVTYNTCLWVKEFYPVIFLQMYTHQQHNILLQTFKQRDKLQDRTVCVLYTYSSFLSKIILHTSHIHYLRYTAILLVTPVTFNLIRQHH